MEFHLSLTNSADDKLMIFFLFFLENKLLHFMQVSPKETVCMKCQKLSSWKNKKNILNGVCGNFYPAC